MLILPTIRAKRAAAPPVGGDPIAITALSSQSPTGRFSGTVGASLSAVTASAGAQLLLIFGAVNTADLEDSFSVSGGGLTWTRRLGGANDSLGYYGALEFWTAPAGAGGSVAITISSTSSAGESFLVAHVLEIENGGTPGQAKTGDMSGAGAQSLTLDSAPDASSLVVAARHLIPADASNPTAEPGADFTEHYDTATSTTGYGALQSQSRTGSASPTVGWADGLSGSGSLFFGMLGALEIPAS